MFIATKAIQYYTFAGMEVSSFYTERSNVGIINEALLYKCNLKKNEKYTSVTNWQGTNRTKKKKTKKPPKKPKKQNKTTKQNNTNKA